MNFKDSQVFLLSQSKSIASFSREDVLRAHVKRANVLERCKFATVFCAGILFLTLRCSKTRVSMYIFQGVVKNSYK